MKQETQHQNGRVNGNPAGSSWPEMDLYDYRGEMAERAAELSCTTDYLGLAFGKLCMGTFRMAEFITRKPRREHPVLERNITKHRAAIRHKKQELSALRNKADSVEKEQGFLFSCPQCGTASRTGFGGTITKEMAEWLDLEEQTPLCSPCFSRARNTFEEIAVCYADYAGCTSRDWIPGYQIIRDRGWIVTEEEYDDVEEVRDALRLLAAKARANACVSFFWKQHHDREVAGYGPKGNPWYQTVVTYSGRARAVLVEPVAIEQHPENNFRKSHGTGAFLKMKASGRRREREMK